MELNRRKTENIELQCLVKQMRENSKSEQLIIENLKETIDSSTNSTFQLKKEIQIAKTEYLS